MERASVAPKAALASAVVATIDLRSLFAIDRKKPLSLSCSIELKAGHREEGKHFLPRLGINCNGNAEQRAKEK